MPALAFAEVAEGLRVHRLPTRCGLGRTTVSQPLHDHAAIELSEYPTTWRSAVRIGSSGSSARTLLPSAVNTDLPDRQIMAGVAFWTVRACQSVQTCHDQSISFGVRECLEYLCNQLHRVVPCLG